MSGPAASDWAPSPSAEPAAAAHPLFPVSQLIPKVCWLQRERWCADQRARGNREATQQPTGMSTSEVDRSRRSQEEFGRSREGAITSYPGPANVAGLGWGTSVHTCIKSWHDSPQRAGRLCAYLSSASAATAPAAAAAAPSISMALSSSCMASKLARVPSSEGRRSFLHSFRPSSTAHG